MGGDQSPDIASWLTQRGLAAYVKVFIQHEIDVADLGDLTEAHLQDMGLTTGARIKILKAIRATPEQHVVQTAAAVVERRPVSVMFCDIVGSTQRATAMDPEDMRSLLLRYWSVVEQTAARFSGHIAQHLGDGALIYFGYPMAREDDAERAVLAGLSLVNETNTMSKDPNAALQVRIGIATGTVVVNQFGSHFGTAETLAIGQSVNLASRLQSLAAPSSVLIDGLTKTLVEGLFSLQLQGDTIVSGFEQPVTLYTVSGVQRVRSRFEALRPGTAQDFLGRDEEFQRVSKQWQAALAAQGQFVLITGEPGIGKSRMISEAIASVGSDSLHVVLLQCSPHATASALAPVIEWLSQIARISAADPMQAVCAKLVATFGSSAHDLELLSGLLDRNVTTSVSDPQLRRQRTLSAIVEIVANMAKAKPVLLIAEDLHWCDPSTLEFLQRVFARCRDQRFMLLATARPEFECDFGDASARTDLVLPRLARSGTEGLIRQVLAAQSIAPQLVELVVGRTDGVPLFVEELLKSMQQSGAIAVKDGRAWLNGNIADATVPHSLHSILMSRVDALGPNKRIAQVAACIGREFPLNLLARIAGANTDHVMRQVDDIVQSELMSKNRSGANPTYIFRHALVCDAAYSSLLMSERQNLHAVIATVLAESGEPVRPETIAHHLTAAQQIMPAIEKWCEAGEIAKQRSADAEAIEHLSHALRLLEQLSKTGERDELELRVMVALIAPIRALKGFASEDVAKLTARAIKLADRTRNAHTILPLLYNRWVYTFVTSHRQDSEKLARDILERSAYDSTNLLRMTGLRAVAATHFTAGNFGSAAKHFDESLALYELTPQSDLTHAVGLDGKVTALGYNSLSRWCLGDHALAHDHMRIALEHAGRINHVSTTAFITYHHTLLAGALEGNAEILACNGKKLETIGTDHHFEMWMICGRLLQSLAHCLTDATEPNIARSETLFAEFETMGVVYRPLFETIIATACLSLGDPERGQRHIESAKLTMDNTGERWSEAEVLRLEGLLMSDQEKSKQCWEQALMISKTQNAKAWEARVTRTFHAWR
jgi:class 3 adenylate cyclase/tetratricopeptide (TPR) repeat protein